VNAGLAQLTVTVAIGGGFALYFAVAWTVRLARFIRRRTLLRSISSTQVN